MTAGSDHSPQRDTAAIGKAQDPGGPQYLAALDLHEQAGSLKKAVKPLETD